MDIETTELQTNPNGHEAPVAKSPSSVEEYEQRIRGLNAAITRKDTELKAKDTAMAQLREQLKQFEAIASDSELKQAEFRGTLESTTKQVNTLSQERDQLAAARAAADQKLAIATKLVELGHVDVLPFHLRGNLTVDATSDETIKTSVEAFKTDLERLFGNKPAATPPRPSAPPANPSNSVGTFEELQNWVFDVGNLGKPEFAARNDAYLRELAKRSSS